MLVQGANRNSKEPRRRVTMPRPKGGHAESYLLIEVPDAANAPELRPRDIVAVDPQAELAHGDFVHIEIRYKKALQRSFRQYRDYGSAIRLEPLNRNYRSYIFGA